MIEGVQIYYHQLSLETGPYLEDLGLYVAQNNHGVEISFCLYFI